MSAFSSCPGGHVSERPGLNDRQEPGLGKAATAVGIDDQWVELFRVTEGDPGPVSAEIVDQYLRGKST